MHTHCVVGNKNPTLLLCSLWIESTVNATQGPIVLQHSPYILHLIILCIKYQILYGTMCKLSSVKEFGEGIMRA